MIDNILLHNNNNVYCVFLLLFRSIYPITHFRKDLYVQLHASRKVW